LLGFKFSRPPEYAVPNGGPRGLEERWSGRLSDPVLLYRWSELLDRWQELASTTDAPDVAYWYGERALTGLLSAAVRQAGGAALQGVAESTDAPARRAPVARTIGMQLPSGVWYAVEADHLPVDQADTAPATATTALGRTRKRLQEQFADYDDYDRVLALCLLAVSGGPDPRRAAALVDAVADAVGRSSSDVLLATYSCQPPEAPPRFEDTFYPGFVIVGQVDQ
jgi:hypothetical protein